MLKKKSQTRFQTAGTRIIRNGLPADFFSTLEKRRTNRAQELEHSGSFYRSNSSNRFKVLRFPSEDYESVSKEDFCCLKDEAHLPPVRGWIVRQSFHTNPATIPKLAKVSNSTFGRQKASVIGVYS